MMNGSAVFWDKMQHRCVKQSILDLKVLAISFKNHTISFNLFHTLTMAQVSRLQYWRRALPHCPQRLRSVQPACGRPHCARRWNRRVNSSNKLLQLKIVKTLKFWNLLLFNREKPKFKHYGKTGINIQQPPLMQSRNHAIAQSLYAPLRHRECRRQC